MNMMYEVRLKDIKLMILEQRRESNLIIVYQLVNKFDKVNRDDLLKFENAGVERTWKETE